MSHSSKALTHDRTMLYRSIVVFYSVFAVSLITGSLFLSASASALSLSNVTNSVTNLVTMGKNQPDPIYVPAPSNAPAAANSAPTATTPNSVLKAEAIAASGTAESGSTKINSNTSSSAKSAQARIIQSKDGLYNVTQLAASQRHLVHKIAVIGLLGGGSLFIVGLAAYGFQKLDAYKQAQARPVSRHKEVQA